MSALGMHSLPRKADTCGGFIGKNLSVANMNDAVGVFGDIGLVSHEHDRVAPGVKIIDQGHDFVAGL